MASKKRFSNEDFLAFVRDYFSAHASVWDIELSGRPGRPIPWSRLSETRFYYFNHDAWCALSHAVADLALEEASGTFLAAFQQFRHFAPVRELYEQLGITLDRVEVIAAGRPPKRVPHVKFRRDTRGACRAFRLALHQGAKHQAAALGREINPGVPEEQARYLGFYTFAPALIERFEAEFGRISGRAGAVFSEFDRLLAIDRAARHIRHAFSREIAAVAAAVRRLQVDGHRYRAGHFASDVEKGLSRLQASIRHYEDTSQNPP